MGFTGGIDHDRTAQNVQPDLYAVCLLFKANRYDNTLCWTRRIVFAVVERDWVFISGAEGVKGAILYFAKFPHYPQF